MRFNDTVDAVSGDNEVSFSWHDWRPEGEEGGTNKVLEGTLRTSPGILLAARALQIIARATGVTLEHRATRYGDPTSSRYDARATVAGHETDQESWERGQELAEVVLAEMDQAALHPVEEGDDAEAGPQES